MSFLKKILKSNTHSRELREQKEKQGKEENPSGGHKSGDVSSTSRSRPRNLTSPRTGSPRKSKPHSRSSSVSFGSRSNSPSPADSPRGPTTYEVRCSTNPHVAQVLPGLLLGSQEFAQDLSALNRHKVTHILNITGEVENSFPARFQYMRVPVTDMPNIKLEQFFPEAFHFINTARSSGCVLVHCYFGASRSASIVIGYLMKTERMKYREALAYLQMIRPEVYPNDGFEKQLREYEHKLHSSSSSSHR